MGNSEKENVLPLAFQVSYQDIKVHSWEEFRNVTISGKETKDEKSLQSINKNEFSIGDLVLEKKSQLHGELSGYDNFTNEWLVQTSIGIIRCSKMELKLFTEVHKEKSDTFVIPKENHHKYWK